MTALCVKIVGETHYTILRAPDGSPWGPIEVYQGGSDREFVLSSLPPFPISQGSQDDVLYRFGTLDNIETKLADLPDIKFQTSFRLGSLNGFAVWLLMINHDFISHL
ncbi:hypothetical protein [Shewanella hanedai]|uniref:Uncharacterized protein n=1 Tax=Shewanella hanedai TaxID=25 RepID=A0A553JK19_SHEHA|nr:hypothetical protein [Shewanella hanedai]TRY12805.1 hypothetical protein FN961_18470 [Shewanella hanedai]